MVGKQKIADKKSINESSNNNDFEHLARDIINSVGVGIYIVRDGKFVYVSPLYQEITGYSEEEILGRNSLDYLHPEDREPTRVRAISSLKGEISEPYEYRFIRKNGRVIWVLERVTSIMYAGQRSALGSFMDISERKQMEEKIRHSEERYRNIIEQMEDGYFEVDLAGKFTFVNDAECRNLGYSREELIGMDSRSYADEKNAREIFRVFQEAYKARKPIKAYDLELIRKDKTKAHHELSATLIYGENNVPIGFRGIARDVTERKLMEEKIRQSEDRYRTILDEMEEWYFETDIKGNITFFNDIFFKVLGYSAEELAGLNFRAFIRPEEVPTVYKTFNKVFEKYR